MRSAATVALVVVSAALPSCADTTQGIRTEFVGSYAFSAIERRTIERIAGEATREARMHLPGLAPQILLQVTSGKDVIPEVGATATVAGTEFVRWTVDPDHPQGVVKIAESDLRGTLFHEFHHLVRAAHVNTASVMDHVVTEGMASAFERDFAGASYPWSQYPDEVPAWVDELLALPPDADFRDWIAKRQPDGRRWVGMRAGTYLVDRAMKTLQRSSAELVSVSTADILAAAGQMPPTHRGTDWPRRFLRLSRPDSPLVGPSCGRPTGTPTRSCEALDCRCPWSL
jgi:hypothetical protein